MVGWERYGFKAAGSDLSTERGSGSKGNEADYVGLIPEGSAGTLCGICLIIVSREVSNFDLVQRPRHQSH